MSRPYAEVIGDPIAQSKSPAIHNFWLGKLGIDAEYRACHVTTEGLADYFAQRRKDAKWRGCNVTMPHKQAVIPLLDRLSPTADRIGAVNTITMEDYYLIGDNTDAPGFLEPLKPFLEGKTCVVASLIGGGGAARAIADALDEAENTIISYSRDPAKTVREIGRYIWDKDLLLPLSRLAEPFDPKGHSKIEGEPDRLDILVNCSPLGMAGYDPLNINLEWLAEDTVIYDIVTTPLETDLFKQARAAGFRTIDGLSMLIGQAAVAFEKFFGVPPPRDDGDAELRKLLTG